MHRDIQKEKRVAIILLVCITILLAIGSCFTLAIYQSTKPIKQAKKEAIQIAKANGYVKSVDDFYRYSRKSTTYSLLGKDKQGKEVYVLIPASGKGIQSIDKKEGVDDTKAKEFVLKENPQETFVASAIGLEETKPTWEIVTKSSDGKFNYYLVDFKEGKIVKSIKNV